MENYIFKDFSSVKEWIDDNKLVKYNFRTGRSGGDTRDSNFVFVYDADSTPQENLRILERRLNAHAGMHLYGTGFRTSGANTGGLTCEVNYGREQQPSYMEQLRGMIGSAPAVDPDKLERDLTEKLELRFKLQRLEDERKEFERERKEYEAEKNSAIGAVIGYIAPIAQLWLQKQGLAKVAGADVQAEKITPISDPDTDETDANDLPDEEAQRAYALLQRFRAVEPDYLQLLESVVSMAERGDQMYNTAKSFLCPK